MCILGQSVELLNDAKISVKKSDLIRETAPSVTRYPRPPLESKSDPDSALTSIWIQHDERQPVRTMIDRTLTVSDLIRVVHNGQNDGDSYQASYGDRQMDLSDRLPSSTTPTKPIKLRKTVNRPPMPVTIY